MNVLSGAHQTPVNYIEKISIKLQIYNLYNYIKLNPT